MYSVFGRNTHDEWSKNAQCIQFAFEQKMISIPRTIANAESIFSANGNPTQHPLQQQYLNTESVQKEISDSLKRLKIEKVERELEAQALASKMDVDANGNPKEVELTEKQKRQLYLNNIDTKDIYKSNRKRARKQRLTLKPMINPDVAVTATNPPVGNQSGGASRRGQRRTEDTNILSKYGIGGNVEEGEIRYLPLDDRKMVLCESWFEFVRRYNGRETIRSVMMLQEGMDSVSQYDDFKKRLSSQGRNVVLDIKDKSAEIQNKIYDVLEMGKKKITKMNSMSLKTLKEIVNRKNQESRQRVIGGLGAGGRGSHHLGSGGRKQILDPYSNEAVRLREQEQAAKRAQERKVKKSADMAMDEDSEEEDLFDALHSHNVSNIAPKHGQSSHANGASSSGLRSEEKSNRTVEIGKDDYAQRNTAFRPIRPGNVDDTDIIGGNGNDDVWGIGSGSEMGMGMAAATTKTRKAVAAPARNAKVNKIVIPKRVSSPALGLAPPTVTGLDPPQIPQRETTEEKEDAKWAKYSYQNHQQVDDEEEEVDF